MENEILSLVKARHYKTSEGYLSNTHCPLAQALKEQFKGKEIRVDGYNAYILDAGIVTRYNITHWLGLNKNRIDMYAIGYGGFGCSEFCNLMKKRALGKKSVPNIQVKLIDPKEFPLSEMEYIFN